MERRKQLSARVDLLAALRGSEEWQPSYKADKANFRALVRAEAQLATDLAEYFNGLSERADRFVDWTQMPVTIQAAATPSNGDPVWKDEEANLTAAIIDAITALLAVGGQSGEIAYGIDLGIDTLDEAILKAARTQTAQLVGGVTETTRDLIREAVQQSIARGEDVFAARARLEGIIKNPVRADLIARTESVNGYQAGLRNFAGRTGAVSKTWESIIGACSVCRPLDGKTIDIDELFVLPNGREVQHPSAHPRCRCGLIYNY